MSLKPQSKSLGELLKQARTEASPRPRRRPASDQPPLVIKSIALTPAASAILDRLIAHASARTGRKASASAVIRALLRWAEQHDLTADLEHLLAAEVATGEVVWGRVRRGR